MSKQPVTPPIQSLDRGLVLLEAIANARRPVSLAELTPILGIDRSSVFRLANTLKQRGFLVQLPTSKEYVLGSTIWRLAGLFQFGSVLMQVAREHVNALATETGETTHLAIREGRHAILVENQLSAQPVGVAGNTGAVIPLHCASIGKALVADFDQKQLAELLGHESLTRFTKKTITSLSAFASECELTRKRGFALDDEEQNLGVRCIAAPVRDASGTIVAAIGISAPASRLPHERIKAVAARVMASAAGIGDKLGHATPENGGK